MIKSFYVKWLYFIGYRYVVRIILWGYFCSVLTSFLIAGSSELSKGNISLKVLLLRCDIRMIKVTKTVYFLTEKLKVLLIKK